MKKLALLLPLILFLACQKAPVAIEYVKYDSDAAIPRISAVDAKKEYDAGNAVFVDSRGEAAWKAERLPGALEISMGATDEKLSTLPKGKKIIVYCS
jgi:hypothetical protein